MSNKRGIFCNFEEIRFLSKSWFLVVDLKQLTELFYSHPRTVE